MERWLKATHYRTAHPQEQRNMRSSGMMPSELSAREPPSYRLWRICEDHNELWWDGGIARQPHLLMLEFQACRLGQAEFMQWLQDIQAAQVAAQEHLRSVVSGYQRKLGR